MARAIVFSENPQLAAELVTLAAGVADEVQVVSIGAAAAATASNLSGVSAVVGLIAGDAVAEDAIAAAPRPEAYVAALAEVVRGHDADVLLVGATVTGWEVAARVATLLGVGLVSEAAGLRVEAGLRTVAGEGWRAERVMYAGGAVQTESWSGLAVVTISPGQAAAAAAGAGTAPVEAVAAEVDNRVRVVSRSVREREGVDLAQAARVVCVGMGLDSVDDLALANGLAEALDAEVACTRPVAEDREWLPTERYIGISGVSVRPDLYIGLGVSGQVQHTIGIRDAKVIVGINSNPDATIFGVCDYGVVGDLHEIAPLLTAAVRSARGVAQQA